LGGGARKAPRDLTSNKGSKETRGEADRVHQVGKLQSIRNKVQGATKREFLLLAQEEEKGGPPASTGEISYDLNLYNVKGKKRHSKDCKRKSIRKKKKGMVR